MSATMFSHFAPSSTFRFRMPAVLTVWYRRMRNRTRDRDALALMSDRDLMDMRATRYEVMNELAKPFWRG